MSYLDALPTDSPFAVDVGGLDILNQTWVQTRDHKQFFTAGWIAHREAWRCRELRRSSRESR